MTSFENLADGLPSALKEEAARVGFETLEHMGDCADRRRRMRSNRFDEINRGVVSLDAIEPNLTSNYLVKGWIDSGCLTMLYEPSHAGKSLVALDLALHVARDERWRGLRVGDGAVLYIAAEGGFGVFNRLAALKLTSPIWQRHLSPCSQSGWICTRKAMRRLSLRSWQTRSLL